MKKESEEKYTISEFKDIGDIKDVLNETPSCLKLLNKAGELITMNPKGLSLIEADSLESVVGCSVYDLVEESYREEFKEFNEKVCSGHKGSLVFEIIGLKGTKRWMETYASPFTLSNGDKGHIAITNDITEKIKAEQENLIKEKALAESSRLSSLGQFVGGVAHEINNPLTIVTTSTSYLKLYLKKHDSIDKDLFLKTLDQIEETAIRMAEIVNNLKSFSRSPKEEDRGLNNLKSIVEGTINLSRNKFKLKGIEIRENYMDCQVNCNPTQLAQVIINLINNATDALENETNAWIEITISEINDNGVRVSVKDSGDRIPNELVDKIMEPFFTTKSFGKGTGLGLSISRNIINDHGGKLYYNKEANNCEFVFELPRSNNSNEK